MQPSSRLLTWPPPKSVNDEPKLEEATMTEVGRCCRIICCCWVFESRGRDDRMAATEGMEARWMARVSAI